jgi:peptidoglycan/LPS O-acetylase OafA/YrhL
LRDDASPRRFEFIDALRGLAFLAVLIHHAAPRIPGLKTQIATLASQGHEGVELFFLLSALTLFLSLDARRRTERRPIVNYFIRRYFRIAPLFYLAALFYYWYDQSLTGGKGPGGSSLGCILSTSTFTHGWSVPWINRLVPGGWSIAVEMNFYLLVPLLFLRIRSAGQAAVAALVALVVGGLVSSGAKVLLARFGIGSAEELSGFTWYWLPAQLPIFFLGILLYFLVRPSLEGDTGRPTATRVNANLLLGIAVYLMVALSFSKTTLFLGHGLFGVAFLLLGWSLAIHPNRWLVNSATRYLGNVSFSAYITHFAVLDLVDRSMKNLASSSHHPVQPIVQFAVLVVATLAGTTLVSSLTHRLIEVPGQGIGRSLIRRLESYRPAEEFSESPA